MIRTKVIQTLLQRLVVRTHTRPQPIGRIIITLTRGKGSLISRTGFRSCCECFLGFDDALVVLGEQVEFELFEVRIGKGGILVSPSCIPGCVGYEEWVGVECSLIFIRLSPPLLRTGGGVAELRLEGSIFGEVDFGTGSGDLFEVVYVIGSEEDFGSDGLEAFVADFGGEEGGEPSFPRHGGVGGSVGCVAGWGDGGSFGCGDGTGGVGDYRFGDFFDCFLGWDGHGRVERLGAVEWRGGCVGG